MKKVFDPLLAASFKYKTYAGASKFMIRGSKEWDEREWEREKCGADLLSYGTLYESNRTNGRSSGKRMN